MFFFKGGKQDLTSINVPKDERLVKGWVGGLLDKKGKPGPAGLVNFVGNEPKGELFLGIKFNIVIFGVVLLYFFT